jgi:hypothetical protein
VEPKPRQVQGFNDQGGIEQKQNVFQLLGVLRGNPAPISPFMKPL